MSDVWETKDGRRRVRRDPPTIEEAVLAAQGLTEELRERIEIVASLIDTPSPVISSRLNCDATWNSAPAFSGE